MLVKILRLKWVIRFFGVALMLAPIVNTISSILKNPDVTNPWAAANFMKVISTSSPPYLILFFSSFVIGCLMLSGSQKAWRYVLVLLGGYLLLQIRDLGQDMKVSKMAGVHFVVNLGLFFFIADQLLWTKALPVKKSPSSNPIPPENHESVSSKQKILVNLDGHGLWAQLVGISKKGLHLRTLNQIPDGMEQKKIEFQLKNGPSLRVRFARKSKLDLFFEYENLTPKDAIRLNQWILQRG